MKFVGSLLFLFVSMLSRPCSASTVTCQTRENLPPNSAVCNLISLFNDVPGAPNCSLVTCTFSLIQQGPDFAVALSSGVISTLRSLDREALAVQGDPVTVSLALLVMHGALVPFHVTVDVLVYDENDETPTFQSPMESISLKEDAVVGSRSFVQRAVDRDAGQNGNVTYKIESGNKDGAFKLIVVNKDLLYLTPAKSLDRETTDHYLLNISAHDHGQPPLWGFHLINVTILDANDHFPQFTKKVYNKQLQENAPAGTFLLQVSAVDPDLGAHGLVTYSIRNELRGPELHFTIDADTGVVRTTSLSFDYETLKRNFYIFWVFANDNGSASDMKSSEIEVTVHIDDVNDERPEIEITFYPGGKPQEVSVWEDAPVGGLLADVSLKDPDRGSARRTNITGKLKGGDGFFRYNPHSGTLTLAKTLDYETQKLFRMTMVACDNGNPPLTSEFNFTVEVLDRNDNRPTFNRPVYSGQVAENSPVGEQVVRVQASDKDERSKSELVYSIVGETDWFTINSTSGWISVASPPDREMMEVVTLVVQVDDGGSASLSPKVNVTIHITDENDMHPVFDSNAYNFNTAEGRETGSIIGQVKASDRDFGQNGVVRYELKRQNAYFGVYSETGIIWAKTALDYEHQVEYTFDVVASDGGVPSLQASVTVTVTVEDQNDNSPTFIQRSPVYVTTSQLAGSDKSLVALTANDPDTGEGGRVSYSIFPLPPSKDLDLFGINSKTGVVSTLHSLVHVTPMNYSFVVRARDNGADDQRSSTIKLIIQVDPPGGHTGTVSSDVGSDSGDSIDNMFVILVVVLVVLIAIFVTAIILFVLRTRNPRFCARLGDIEKGKPDLKSIARRSSSRVQFANQDDILEYPVQIDEEEKEPTTERADPDGENTPDKETEKCEIFVNKGAEDLNSSRSRKPLQVSDEQELQKEADEDSDSESTDSGHHTSDSVTTPSSIRSPPGVKDTLHEDGKLTSHV